jgi:cytochrome c-type biogenesis protein CcmH
MAGDAKGADGKSPLAGRVLLGVAALLAAVSIGYNILEDREREAEPASAQEAQPTLDQLRAAAAASPGDAQGWAALGFALFSRGRYQEAAEAYGRATEIDSDAGVLFSALGEALLYAEEAGAAGSEPMPPAAAAAFERAVELDPDDPRARYFLAVKKDRAGDHEGALGDWLDLLADSPPGAPWEGELVQAIERLGAAEGIAVEERIAAAMAERGAAAGGPSPAEIEAAQAMSREDREAMVEGMVERLKTRLQDEPGDLNGWVMLMRSRVNLGEADKAKSALERAIAANPDREAELRRAAQMLGIE